MTVRAIIPLANGDHIAANHEVPPQEWAGYRQHRRSDAGTTIVLVNGREHGICGEEEGPWFLVCDEHATLLSDSNRRRLWTHARTSDGWCEYCRTLLDERRDG